MKSFDFLSAILACLVAAAAIYGGLKMTGLRLTLRLERAPGAARESTGAVPAGDDGRDPA